MTVRKRRVVKIVSRIAAHPTADLQVHQCGVDPKPINLGVKMLQGGLCALIALLMLTTLLFRGLAR